MIANEVYLLAKYSAKSPGPRLRNMVAEDLVEQYMSVLGEELFNDRVAVQKIETEDQFVNPQALLIVCSIGESFSKSAPKRNLGRIYSSGGTEDDLTCRVREGISQWGKLYGFAHGTQSPILRGGPCGFRLELEPFQINAPDAESLAPHLHKLGRDLAGVIADFGARKRKIQYGT